jgi:hypothetical protein
VQKLYAMVRNNESWELGDPELNDRGQPVIHDIASKLGCIRPSPDLPYAFPEGSDDFAELQAQLQAAGSDSHSVESGSQKTSHDASSPALDRTERASSSESDHSTMSQDYNHIWAQQKKAAAKTNSNLVTPTPLNLAQRVSLDDDSHDSHRASFDASRSIPSPIYTDFQTESPLFRHSSPFSPWSAGDEFLTPPHLLDGAAPYLRPPYPTSTVPSAMDYAFGVGGLGLETNVLKAMPFDSMNFAEGTIRPGILDSHSGYDLQMDSIIYNGDYDGQMSLA